jgi:hypothetical protein
MWKRHYARAQGCDKHSCKSSCHQPSSYRCLSRSGKVWNLVFNAVVAHHVRIILVWNSSIIGTCACAQEVHWVQTDISSRSWLWQYAPQWSSSLRDTSLSKSMNTSQSGQKNQLFSLWVFISDRFGIIDLHQVPTSVAGSGWYGHYGFDLVFLQCLEYDVLLNTVLGLARACL